MRILDDVSSSMDKQKISVLTHLQNGDLDRLKENEVWRRVKPSKFDSACEKLLKTIQEKSTKEKIAINFALFFKLLQEKLTEIREKKFIPSEYLKIVHVYKEASNMLTKDMDRLLLKEKDDNNVLKQLYDLIFIEQTIFKKNLEILKLKNQIRKLDDNNYSLMPMAERSLLYCGAAVAACIFLIVNKKVPLIPLVICTGMIASSVYTGNQLKHDKKSKSELEYRCNNIQEKIALLEAQKRELKKLTSEFQKLENEQNNFDNCSL